MNLPARMISREEVREAIESDEVIEDYRTTHVAIAV